ncbi:MAG: hypothetical protein IKS49_05250 [Actinomycetaceae bacterium]|nr:hypothetical protein [Actinomycetaceae bacterium]
MFEIRMGVPEMAEYWRTLKEKIDKGNATKEEASRYKKIGKALVLLSNNPRHPGLNSHEISALTARYGIKVWESYLENNKPAAGRIFWVYGPNQGDITIIGIEPHPNDKSNAYKKITLSAMEETEKSRKKSTKNP